MAYIYVITNKVNGRQYVGKTEYSDPVKRFQEHLRESRKERYENRPLYRAIRKYGEENFEFKVLEEVSEEVSCQREIFWIDKLNTYGSSGYNATKGGDGKRYLNYDKIVKDYQTTGTLVETANLNNCTAESVSKILKSKGFKVTPKHCKQIKTYYLGKEIVFNSITEAANWVLKEKLSTSTKVEVIRRSISRAVNGRRKTYLKMRWEEIL